MSQLSPINNTLFVTHHAVCTSVSDKYICPDTLCFENQTAIFCNCSEPTSKMLRISSVWHIRQIDFHIIALICASTLTPLHKNPFGSKQLHILNSLKRLNGILIRAECRQSEIYLTARSEA